MKTLVFYGEREYGCWLTRSFSANFDWPELGLTPRTLRNCWSVKIHSGYFGAPFVCTACHRMCGPGSSLFSVGWPGRRCWARTRWGCRLFGTEARQSSAAGVHPRRCCPRWWCWHRRPKWRWPVRIYRLVCKKQIWKFFSCKALRGSWIFYMKNKLHGSVLHAKIIF